MGDLGLPVYASCGPGWRFLRNMWEIVAQHPTEYIYMRLEAVRWIVGSATRCGCLSTCTSSSGIQQPGTDLQHQKMHTCQEYQYKKK